MGYEEKKEEPLNISSDQYKQEWCSIQEDECTGFYCTTCRVARDHIAMLEIEKGEHEHKSYTQFTTPGKMYGVPILRNTTNIIALMDEKTLTDIRKAMEKEVSSEWKLPIKEVGYCPDSFKQHPAFAKLQHYNSLGIPDKILIEKDVPAIVYYGDKIYLIAPRIENSI